MFNSSDARSPQHRKLTYVTSENPFWRRSFINCIESFAGQRKLNSLCQDYRHFGETAGNIWADATSDLHLNIKDLTETGSLIPVEALLIHEIVCSMNTEIHAVVCNIIKSAQLAAFDYRRKMLNFLRDQVYALGDWTPSTDHCKMIATR